MNEVESSLAARHDDLVGTRCRTHFAGRWGSPIAVRPTDQGEVLFWDRPHRQGRAIWRLEFADQILLRCDVSLVGDVISYGQWSW